MESRVWWLSWVSHERWNNWTASSEERQFSLFNRYALAVTVVTLPEVIPTLSSWWHLSDSICHNYLWHLPLLLPSWRACWFSPVHLELAIPPFPPCSSFPHLMCPESHHLPLISTTCSYHTVPLEYDLPCSALFHFVPDRTLNCHLTSRPSTHFIAIPSCSVLKDM